MKEDGLFNVRISMEMVLVSLFTLAVTVLVYYYFLVRGNWLQLEPRIRARRNELPKGSMGWPILGEIPSFAKAFNSGTPHVWSDERRKKYGNLFLTHLFSKPSIYVTSKEAIKFVLSYDNNSSFAMAYPKSSVSITLGEASILNQNGDRHKVLRKVFGFWGTAERMTSMMEDLEKFSLTLLESLEGKTFSLQQTTNQFAFDVLMWKLLNIPPGSAETRTIAEEIEHLRKGSFTVPVNIPGSGFRRGLKAFDVHTVSSRKFLDHAGMHHVDVDALRRTEFVNYLKGIAGERKAILDQDAKLRNSPPRDFLDALLETDEHGKQLLTEEEIADNIIISIMAGHSSSSRAISFAIMFLTENPQTLKDLKKEHDDIRKELGPSAPISWDHYKKMTFTQKVIDETLRISNVSGHVFRQPTEDKVYEGLLLPKGVKLLLSARDLHTDTKYFPDPYKFDVSRWENPPPVGQFIPFGMGSHKCPGKDFARVEISLFVHHLVTKYSWEAVQPYKLNFFPTAEFKPDLVLRISRLENAKD